ncbi:MAG: hypothetical protein AAF636_13210 [Pseudomonadota bacterium]
MPNAFAYFMLFAWPLIVVVLFKRFPLVLAGAISIIVGYLLLPVQPSINLPVLPSYNKELAMTLPAFIMAAIVSNKAVQSGVLQQNEGWFPKNWALRLCMLMIVVSPLLTAMTNGDPVDVGNRMLPGLSLYDGASNVLAAGLALIPFLLAWKWFGHPDAQKTLLLVLAIALLAYSFLALFEIRMSPRLNNSVYGFFPSAWRQHIRGDGFRPLVFLEHGLRLGIIIAMAILAAIGVYRARITSKPALFLSISIWLLLTLVLCKSVGALIIACVLLPVVFFLSARLQILVAACIAGLVLVYPMARSSGALPIDTITSSLERVVSDGRMASLDFRLRNEEALLNRAQERPLLGWGGWGRNMLYDEDGRNLVVPDGTWIIYFGKEGWLGYIAAFGLLTLPAIFLASRKRSEIDAVTGTLSIVLVANLLDLLPNSGLTPVTWLLAGSIVGRLELGRITTQQSGLQKRPLERSIRYKRDFSDAAPQQGSLFSRAPLRKTPVEQSRSR